MNGKTFYYACVPMGKQSEQVDAFLRLGARDSEIFIDLSTGKQKGRNHLRMLKRVALREGDTLVIPSLTSLSDSKQGVRDELAWLRDSRIKSKVMELPVTMQELPGEDARTAALINEMLLEMYDITVLKEVEFRARRQKEGIQTAREQGVQFGRRPMVRAPRFYELKKEWEHGAISMREAARQLGVTHRTFHNWVREEKAHQSQD
ncbi:MAG: recombinase family protein [Agathobaculum sp.]|uniref:recombinase family protein n=1 Tax=Agathobaculum sp. TaxID=2048138 RepID=UPI0025BF5F7F|nr:recombinase family protein [Agathobaculum sp.]MCI7125420.1 recombinase family protein [Agathobaculum sp.]MDY3711832.1 recombinase family protein [Agathobaculum sp.]